MRVLIFTMTCGEGHNMIAGAISSALEERGCTVETVQTFGFDGREVKGQNSLLLFAWTKIPRLYDFFWNFLRKKDFSTDKLPRHVKKCKSHFISSIEGFRPDAIICTHFYAGSVVAYLKKQGLIDKKILTAGIVTDFCLAPFWEQCKGLDVVFSPTESVVGELIAKGFDKESIVTVGLPVRSEFFKPYDTNEYKRKTGLDKGPVILIVGGGFGLGKTEKLVARLLKNGPPATIVVVNGRNEKRRKKVDALIKKRNVGGVVNLGFVDNLCDYLRASDVIVTRCGSSAVTELMTLKKPFIIREKLIISENINKQILVNAGCALGMERIGDVGIMTSYLLDNSEMREKMSAAQQKFIYPDPAAAIARYIIGTKEK